jgi:hypothetical protein
MVGGAFIADRRRGNDEVSGSNALVQDPCKPVLGADLSVGFARALSPSGAYLLVLEMNEAYRVAYSVEERKSAIWPCGVSQNV